jgi:GNAT superfamily N-acetyltransferase
MVCPDWQADDNPSRVGLWDLELAGGLVSRSAVSVRRVDADAPADEMDSLARLWVDARSVYLAPEKALEASSVAVTLRDALQRECVEVFMARVDAHDVGFVVISRGPLLPLLDDVSVSIEHLYVVEEARRLGVGHALLARVTARSEQLGVAQIVTSVPAPGRDVQRFFARLGFGPFMVRRVTSVPALRRRLSWEDHPRLDATVLRRRSLRARSRAVAMRARTSA